MQNQSPFHRQPPASPLSTGVNHLGPSRKPSIVELLSSPPPLPNNTDHDDIHSLSLSRNASISSKASSLTGQSHSSSIIGLDWLDIPLSELTESNKLISIDLSYSVQKAFETLVEYNLTSVPVSLSKDDPEDLTNCLTFDYSDLNTYLLLIMNKIHLNELSSKEIGDPELLDKERFELISHAISRAKKGEEVPVDFIVKLHPKNSFVKFTEAETLFPVMEALGNGVHRVAITNLAGTKITGILSQRRLIKYMWENARRFPSLDFYLNSTLEELKVGSNKPITIYGDQLLIDALHKMFTERVSSLAVIDRSKTLIGNISIVDVKNVSSSKNSHLLFKSVLNFISHNLNLKGIEEGQDQYPIFHVNSQSSLGRVIAKLVATQSHRLWVVESRNHSSSVSSASSVQSPTTVEAALNTTPPQKGDNLCGKLVGVVTLTDILGLFAHTKGKKTDPQFARNQRRSSVSTSRSSMDGGSSAAGHDLFRKSYTGSFKNESVFGKE